MMFDDMQFANPEYFWIFIIIPIILIWYVLKEKKKYISANYSTAQKLTEQRKSLKVYLRHLPLILTLLALSFMIVAVARPQSSSSKKTISSEGIDIVVAMDISTSMLAQDFKPNRLEAAKRTASEFVDARVNDRIGIVIFAGESFTQCPVTIDHKVLKTLFENISIGKIKDGTAIGDGLATSVSRLKDIEESKSKVIILLTDGVNNSGFISPETAAEIADQYDIKVYTIGIGTKGKAPVPVQTPFGERTRMMDVKIDEANLKNIAELTGGKYFRATNNKSLSKIYEEIDKLEKVKIDVAYFNQYTEEFLPFAIAAGVLLILERILQYTYLRRLS